MFQMAYRTLMLPDKANRIALCCPSKLGQAKRLLRQQWGYFCSFLCVATNADPNAAGGRNTFVGT